MPLPTISADEWNAMKVVTEALQVFDGATQELSAENVVTTSKILIVIDGIRGHLFDVRNHPQTRSNVDVLRMVDQLTDSFSSRTLRYENNPIIAEATFLDPRFKKFGIPNPDTFSKTETTLINSAG